MHQIVAETGYDQRPEGYDRLGSYVGGSNEEARRLRNYSPTIMRIHADGDSKSRQKKMQWSLAFASPAEPPLDESSFPASTVPSVRTAAVDAFVVGVSRFDLAATEPVVRYKYLLSFLRSQFNIFLNP